MSYQLSILETLLLEDLPAQYAGAQELPLAFRSAIRQEIKRIKTAILNESYQYPQEHVLQLFIDHHVQDMTALANEFFQSDHPASVVQTCLEAFDEIMDFLFSHFKQYANDDLPLPQHRLNQLTKQTLVWQEELKDHFTRLYLPMPLQKILLQPFEKPGSEKDNSNFREMRYLHVLREHLLAIKEEQECREALLRLNFNSPAYIRLLQQDWNKQLKREKMIEAQRIFISAEMQAISAVAPLPRTAWMERAPGLQDSLTNLLERLLPLQPTLPSLPTIPKPTPALIAVDLSAPEMALLVRLCIDLHVFPQSNRPFLLQQTAKHFSSKGTKHKGLSWESLNAKYSAVEQNTVDQIRNLLINMINQLRKIEKELK